MAHYYDDTRAGTDGLDDYVFAEIHFYVWLHRTHRLLWCDGDRLLQGLCPALSPRPGCGGEKRTSQRFPHATDRKVTSDTFRRISAGCTLLQL